MYISTQDTTSSDLFFKPDGSMLYEIGNDGLKIYQYSIRFKTTETTSDFSSEINDYLSTCTADSNGNCQVPLKLHSDTVGKIEISNINIQYTWDIDNLILTKKQWNQTVDVIANSSYENETLIYWNTSFLVGSNITIDGWYLTAGASSAKYDGSTETVYNASTSTAYINTTDILITQDTDLTSLSNHTLWDDIMGYGIPVVQTETSGYNETIGNTIYWKKNVTIEFYDTDGSIAPSGMFTNATTMTICTSSDVTRDEFIKVKNSTGDWVDITPTQKATWVLKTVEGKNYYVWKEDLCYSDGIYDFKVKIESN